MFDYVMVLVSVIVGLAVTHLMQGVAGMIQQPDRVRVWWVHLVWIGYVLTSAAFFWWWEYALHTLTVWTFQQYLLLLTYAFVIYLGAAILVPHDLADGRSFEDYFIARRRWFFGLQIVWQVLDVLDTLSKGVAHAQSLGVQYLFIETLFITLSAVGIATPRRPVQAAIALVFFVYNIAWAFQGFGTLQ